MKKYLKLIISVGLLALAGVLGSVTGYFNSLSSIDFHTDLKSVISAILSVLALIVIEQLVSLILGAIKPNNHRARTLLSISASIVKYVFGTIALCAVLASFGADVGTVVAGMGILALIIGFGAESLIADLITGLFAIVENQYNVGDIIEVDGFRGTVSNIGIRTTSLTDAGGNVLIINNANMKNVLNRSNNRSISVCVFPIPYEADLRALENELPAMLNRIYENHRDMMVAVPEYLGVDKLGDSSVDLKFIVEVEEKNIYNAGRIMNHDLYLAMKDMGIEVPFPQLDVHNR